MSKSSDFGTPLGAVSHGVAGGFGGGKFPNANSTYISDAVVAQAIYNCSIYEDERDTTLAKWNFIQARWGSGRCFYSQNCQPAGITPRNFLCRLKAIGYCRLPGNDNKQGSVALNINKASLEIKVFQQQLLNSLNAIFANRPHFVINIESVKEFEEGKAQAIIFVTEKSQFVASENKRIPAVDLSMYLNQPNVKAHLATLGIYEVSALVQPDEEQLDEFLNKTPEGVDTRMWREAQIHNPLPRDLIPVPIIGFKELKKRMTFQEYETDVQDMYLKRMNQNLAELKQRFTSSSAKIKEYKRKMADLSHSMLRIAVKLECTRKIGLSLTPEEEDMKNKLENMLAIISAPTQFKGRLSELLSQLKMQPNQYSSISNEYVISKESEEEMSAFLALLQKAMEVLTDTVSKDIMVLQLMYKKMPELARN